MLIEYVGPHSLGPIGGSVKFIICARVCQVEDRMSILSLCQIEFNIPQLVPFQRSAQHLFAMSKFVATPLLANLSFSFCFGLFKVIPRTTQSSCIENLRRS